MGLPTTSRSITRCLPLSPASAADSANSAELHKTAILAMFFQVEVDVSKEREGLPRAPVSISPIWLSIQTWATVATFLVRVPVLSQRITDVEPSVSTASKFLITQFREYSLLADKLRAKVTTARSPSGTFATMTPMRKTMASIQK